MVLLCERVLPVIMICLHANTSDILLKKHYRRLWPNKLFNNGKGHSIFVLETKKNSLIHSDKKEMFNSNLYLYCLRVENLCHGIVF